MNSATKWDLNVTAYYARNAAGLAADYSRDSLKGARNLALWGASQFAGTLLVATFPSLRQRRERLRSGAEAEARAVGGVAVQRQVAPARRDVTPAPESEPVRAEEIQLDRDLVPV